MTDDGLPSGGLCDGGQGPSARRWDEAPPLGDIGERTGQHATPPGHEADTLARLLPAVAMRERAAFDALYDASVQQVYSLAVHITRQSALAENVVAEVYLQVWQTASAYEPGHGTVMAWLCTMCRRHALDAVRCRADDTPAVRGVAEDTDADPDALLALFERGSAVRDALERLSEVQRQLIVLAYFRGYTHRELAQLLSMPVGTLKAHMDRAVTAFRERVSDMNERSGRSNE